MATLEQRVDTLEEIARGQEARLTAVEGSYGVLAEAITALSEGFAAMASKLTALEELMVRQHSEQMDALERIANLGRSANY